MDRARRDGAGVLGLHTSELMTVARRMYGSMGFRVERELPPNYGLRYWLYTLDPHEPAHAGQGEARDH